MLYNQTGSGKYKMAAINLNTFISTCTRERSEILLSPIELPDRENVGITTGILFYLTYKPRYQQFQCGGSHLGFSTIGLVAQYFL